jgi:hypothetical protein
MARDDSHVDLGFLDIVCIDCGKFTCHMWSTETPGDWRCDDCAGEIIDGVAFPRIEPAHLAP